MFRILALLLCSIAGLAMIAEASQPDDAALKIEINGRAFAASLENNATAKAFADRLPLTLDMNELNGNEKYHYLEKPLPSASESVKQIHAGDIMLYGDNCIVVFYKSFTTSYRYTRIGRINGAVSLDSVVGNGNITVKFFR